MQSVGVRELFSAVPACKQGFTECLIGERIRSISCSKVLNPRAWKLVMLVQGAMLVDGGNTLVWALGFTHRKSSFEKVLVSIACAGFVKPWLGFFKGCRDRVG